MFKLLPSETRKAVEREYRLRRTVVVIVALSVILACGLVGFLPTYAAITAREDFLNQEITTLNTSPHTSADNNLKAWAEDLRKKIVTIVPVKDTDRPYEIFLSVLAVRPRGVHLNSLAQHRDGHNQVVISIAGVADTRQDLLAFENALNQSKTFAPSTFPVSDLASSADINFAFDLNPAS